MNIESAKLQYGYLNRAKIEGCNETSFKIAKTRGNNDLYILYGDILYEANFEEKHLNAVIQKTVSINNKEKILNAADITEYTSKELIKVYSGINYNSLNYLKRTVINIQNIVKGSFINPQIYFDNNKAVIKNKDEVIAKVNDVRSITLLKAINKYRDLVCVYENKLYIYTLKSINKDINNHKELEIIVYDDSKYVTIDKIKKAIKDGCKINDDIWLFALEDTSDALEDNIILILPEEKYYKCVLTQDGKLLIKKSILKPKKVNGYCTAMVLNSNNIKFTKKDNYIDHSDENAQDNFNKITMSNSNNSDFSRLIFQYKKIESDILEENKTKCVDLRYSYIDGNYFKIHQVSKEHLEKWQGKEGVSLSYKGKTHVTIGTVLEISDDYIKVEFNNDMVKGSIPQKDGLIGISFIGDEVMRRRRENAIKLLENHLAAIPELSSILSGSHNFKNLKYNHLLDKYELGNLVGKQIQAIEGVLNTSDIYLIQGPPGTGKTTVIRKIVEKAIETNKEVLITSYQNLAVDNVLDGFLSSNVIPHRFGLESNNIMQKICNEVVDEINKSLKSNASLDQEEILEKTRERLNQLSIAVLDCETLVELKDKINESLEVISKYIGKNSNYIKLEDIISKLSIPQGEKEIFNINFVKNTMPEVFSYDFQVIEAFEATENYLAKIDNSLNDNTLKKIIKKLKDLQELDIIFTLEDKEYQKIKHWIFDELRLVKNSSKTIESEIDIFDLGLEASSIIDEVINNIPSFIEDSKYQVIKKFHEKISNNPTLIEEVLKKYPDIRGTTCQKTASYKFVEASKGINYDYVIVDEAARANPLDLLIPLIKGDKIILVGDHKQLPHMLEDYVESKFKNQDNFDPEVFNKYIKESLFGRLYEELPNNRKIMLDTQYRMTEEIGDLVSDLFYEGNLKTGTKIVNDTPLYTGNALISIDVKGNQQKTHSGSYINNDECKEILQKLQELNEKCEGEANKQTVGVISFYKSQVDKLNRKIHKLNLPNIDVKVGTVDAYQGLEKDIIFLSTVRTFGIGFIGNPNRLNVALSRAKKLVVVFGDTANLKSNILFSKVLERCKTVEEAYNAY